MIELKKITKQFANQLILNNIDLTINEGEIFGLLGLSGAGKSSLLRCINLLEKPQTGEVWVNHVNLTSLNADQLRHQRQKIGVIFQHFNLLSTRTVFENIALPLEIQHLSGSQIKTKVSDLLDIVGLSHKKNAYPSELSGGQKQRVAIARALAGQPHVLLCDEATSALDTQTTQSILQLLKTINQQFKITIVIVSHELEVIKQICDRVGILDQGKIIELNSTINIFAHPQQQLTQQLVQQSLHLYQPQKSQTDAVILKLTFIGNDSKEPLISNLVKRFDVTVNIIHALIEKIQNNTVGFTICELTGEQNNLQAALNYIKSTSINSEVLHA